MRTLFFIFSIGILISSCGNNEGEIKVDNAQPKENPIDTYDERVSEIDKFTALLFEDSLTFNQQHAEQLLAAYQEFIKHHSFDTISLEYEFKAGEIAKALGQHNVAIKHFNNLMDRSPDHRRAPMALFLKAMIVGDVLQEHETARIYYQEFIDKYPEHPFAASAKASINLQGRDLNDIIKEFEEKNKANS